jgi:hypothetical protein
MKWIVVAFIAISGLEGLKIVSLLSELRIDQAQLSEFKSKLLEAENRLVRIGSITARPIDPIHSPVAQPIKVPSGTDDVKAFGSRSANTIVERERQMLQDPAYRQARYTQIRLSIPQSYPGLLDELDLTPAEVDELWKILAEHQLSRTANAIPMMDGKLDPASAPELGRALKDDQRKLDESISSLLGGARFQEWEEYQQTRPSRQFARTYLKIEKQVTRR